jgi:transposase
MLDKWSAMDIYKFTIMPTLKRKKTDDAKIAALREQHALNPRPDAVKDGVFGGHEFFDARDLVQIRYEMLRRHRVEGRPVTEAAAAFGLSRQAFYKTSAVFEKQGVSGLLPQRRGPKGAHKCTDEILDFAEQWRSSKTAVVGQSVVDAIREHFGVRINARSIERALSRRKKKRRGKKTCAQ